MLQLGSRGRSGSLATFAAIRRAVYTMLKGDLHLRPSSALSLGVPFFCAQRLGRTCSCMPNPYGVTLDPAAVR